VSPEQWAALALGVGSVLAGLGRVIYEIRRTHRLVNSRMGELLELTRKSSMAQGRLEAGESARPRRPRRRQGRVNDPALPE
jgi:hypothetical protein